MRHRLTERTGLPALGLDAMASVAYGPEAIVLVLAAAGGAGLGLTLPVTAAIAVLLALLVTSYRSVIAVFPDGGGAYAVARRRLGTRASLIAAGSLVIDYVLNVAVSLAAGVAALTTVVPGLRPWTVELCLTGLLIMAAVNLRGIAAGARLLVIPTCVFVGSILAVIVAGLLRDAPAAVLPGEPAAVGAHTVGVLLLLKAFSAGCAALTGVEAIANAVPSFRPPSARRAARTEVLLGAVLGTLLLGVAALIDKFEIRPVEGVTVLSQVTAASVGEGALYLTVQASTVLLLALAANTSYGGLPTLFARLSDDHFLPHRFALQSAHEVRRWGIGTLTVLAAALLVVTGGQVSALVPLFAIGVFIGFTLAQAGLVVHWWVERPAGWRHHLAVNAIGAAATATAALVTLSMKFTEGAWGIALLLPLVVVVMASIRRTYDDAAAVLCPETLPPSPVRRSSVVVVLVADVDEVAHRTVDVALALGADHTLAVHVCDSEDPAREQRLVDRWDAWDPGVPLICLAGHGDDVVVPIEGYLTRRHPHHQVVVLVGDLAYPRWRSGLSNHRADQVMRRLTRLPNVSVCRQRIEVPERVGPRR